MTQGWQAPGTPRRNAVSRAAAALARVARLARSARRARPGGLDRRRRAILVVGPVLLLTAAIGAFVVARLHHGSTHALVVGLAVAALAMTSGLLLAGGETARAPDGRFRRLFGAAFVLFGVGQFLRCLVVAVEAGPSSHPNIGDAVTLAAAPLAMAGVVAVPRAAGRYRPIARTVLDAGLLSAATSLVVWRVGFVLAGSSQPGSTVMITAFSLSLEIVVASLASVAALRDLDRYLVVVAVGAWSFVLGDVLLLQRDIAALVPGPAVGQLLWLVLWPLGAWALSRYRPMTRTVDEPAPIDVDPDARVTVIITVVSLALLAVGIATMVTQGSSSDPRVDAVSWATLLGAIVVLGIRELHHARLRIRLIGRLHEEATSDPLTGLANRRLLTARLADILPGEPWCLVAVDLDGFKGVNDLLGHSVGDRLLCAVANRLMRNLPRTAVVCRTGGDEFAVLLPGLLREGLAAADVVVASVRRSCWDVEGVTRWPVTASVGVTAVSTEYPVTKTAADDGAEVAGRAGTAAAVGEVGGTDPLSALSAAGAALQLAKAGGRDRIEVFDGAAALLRTRRLSVEERLRRAIRGDELDVRYQPVVDLRTGAISGVEALARWADQRLGIIAPQEFIPVAEQTGLVVELGELVLHRTVQEATEHGLPQRGIRVACNVSPLQLRVPGFPQLVEDALTAHGMPPELLLVEVTEAVLVEEEGPAVQALRRLAEAGVTIAIDDFGTGYSALGYLRRLPAHALKIDRSLTSALVDESEARAITRAVIDLGASLNVSIIVEGIETSDVAELVTSLGAGYGQGTLYGSAMPMTDIVRLSRRPPSTRPA